jgi:hypothetical protein
VIKNGCLTSDGEHDVRFSNGRYGLLLTITTDGRLVPGPLLSDDIVTRTVAGMLVEEFGRAYGLPLQEAADRIKSLEASNGSLKSTVKARDELITKQSKEIARLEAHIRALG